MKFFVSDSQRAGCEHVISELAGMGCAVQVIGAGTRPEINGEAVCTLVPVPELARTGHTPGQVRLVPHTQVAGLGGSLPWRLGEREQLLVVAPPPQFKKVDRGSKRVFKGNLRTQIGIALQAAERQTSTPAK